MKDLSPKEKADIEIGKMNALQAEINRSTWTGHIETLCKTWGEKAQGNQLLHLHESNTWSSFSNRSHLLVILLSMTCGLISIIDDRFVGIHYVVSALSICIGTITSVIKFYKPGEKSEIHQIVSKKYSKLYRLIVLELSLSRNDRQNADLFLTYIRTKMDDLQSDTPHVIQATVKWFLNNAEIMKLSSDNFPDVVRSYAVPIIVNEM
jgi:hypothetical protein